MASSQDHQSYSVPVVSNGCKTWSFALIKEDGATASEDRMLVRILEAKRKERTGRR
jgi:hypothetical protein